MGVLSDRLNKKDEKQDPIKFGLPKKVELPTTIAPAVKEKPQNILGARLYDEQVKREKTPSYYQQYKKINNETPAPVSFGAEQDFNIKKGIDEMLAKKNEPEVSKNLYGIFGGNNIITKFLFGKGSDPESIGKEKGYFTETLPERGIIGFFTGDLLKSDHETAAQLYEVFINNGMDANEAFKKSNEAVLQGKAIGLSPEQQNAYMQWDKWEKIGTVIDTVFLGLDILSAGGSQVVKAGLKQGTRSAMAEALKVAAEKGSRAEVRNVLIKQYPKVKGTEELEKMIDVVENTPDDFSWLKVRNEFRNSKVFKDLANTTDTTAVDKITEAQKVFYQNGIPVVKTVAGNADSAYDARQSIRSVLRGEKEAQRLTDLSVFSSEVKAGSLPSDITLADSVEVYRIGGSGRRMKVGDQVTLSKELAGEGADSFKVPLRDLVRLEDGTFTNVPSELIGKDLSPSIKAVRDVVTREKVAKREADDALRAEMEQIARKQAEKQAEEEMLKKAAKEEADKVAQIEKLTKAKEIVDSVKGLKKTSISKLNNSVEAAAKAIQTNENKITKLVKDRADLIKASTQKAGLTAGRFIQKFEKFMTVTEKNKLRAGKSLTAIERARIQKRLRDSFDTEIESLKATKNTLQENWRKAGADLANTKSLLKQADEAKKILNESAEAVKMEKKAKVQEKTESVAKTAEATARQSVDEFSNLIKENYSVVREESKAVESIVSPLSAKPLKSNGEEIVNKMAKLIDKETDEAYRALGVEGGLDSVRKGTAKLDAKTLEKIDFVHKVASNEQQLKSALLRVVKDPEKAYFDFINSNAMDDSMAALYSALIKSDFIRADVNRLNNIVRHFDRFGTRTAQEQQARQMIGRLDYPNLISKMMRKGDDMMKKRGIDVAAEVAKIEKALGDEFDKLVAVSRTEVLEKLNKLTCDV